MLIVLIAFFILGTLFGSFATVLIERWRHNEGGIIKGRSHCPFCRSTLGITELFPIFSYIFQRGKCKHCHKRIPLFYPLAEGFMGILFVIGGYIGIQSGPELSWVTIVMVLIMVFITGVYALYDIKYMEIPDQIMIPGIYGMVALLAGGFIFPEIISKVFFDAYSYTNYLGLVGDHLLGAFIIYSFFFLQILIPATFYYIKNGTLGKTKELLVSYILFPFLLPFEKNQERDDAEEEVPSWIGGGDLRVALFIGITLGTIHGVIAVFIAYLIGSIIGIPFIFIDRKKHRKIPFGPFLALGWLIVLAFHLPLLEYIKTFNTI